jgi:hypothetical protein
MNMKASQNKLKKGNKNMKLKKTGKGKQNIIMNDHPTIMAPKLDKLSAVINLKDKKLNGMAFYSMINMIKDDSYCATKVTQNGKYQLAAKLYYPGKDGLIYQNGPCLFMQMTNPNLEKLQVRIEYNPSHITQAAENYLDVTFMELFGVEFYEFLYHARFTRVDICMDIISSSLEDYLFKAKWKQASQAIYGANGKLQTVCLGKSGNSQIAIYDKAAQVFGDDATNGIIRVEARCKIKCNILELANLENPFRNFDIYSLACKNPPLGKAHWLAFQDSCRARGIRNAIKKQPVQNRAALKKALASNSVEWWPAALEEWDYLWMNALEDAGLTAIPKHAPALTITNAVGLAA